MSRPLAALSAALALAGCFSKGAVHSYRTEPGPPVAPPDPEDAYVVWHDGAGWHLRARPGSGQVFTGLVESSGVRRVAPVGVAADAVRASRGAIAFAFAFAGDLGGGEAGFDWQGGCADFSLYVDGDARPMRIFAGAYGASPPRIPFSLCP
jgi:hypothetical protein